jgi:hypothetical protein
VEALLTEMRSRFQFAATSDFQARFMRAAGRLDFDQSRLCREAVELYLSIAEHGGELSGLDLLVYIRDAKTRLLDSLKPSPATTGQPIASTRPEDHRGGNTRASKRK